MVAEAFWWALDAALVVGVGAFIWLGLFFLSGFVMAMLGINPKWLRKHRERNAKTRQG